MMWLARETYVQSLLARGKTQEYIDRVMVPVKSTSGSWFCNYGCYCRYYRGTIWSIYGQEHFIKAGMVS